MPHLRVFTVVEFFVPAYKAGGPLRSIWNLIEALGDEFDFYVYTRDRDEGDEQPFARVQRHVWQDIGKAQVFYASPTRLSAASLRRAIETVGPDVIYLNSAFAPMSLRVLVLRRIGMLTKPLIVAPRNELSPGALSLKRAKKRLFLGIARATRLYDDVIWQCSNGEEADQVRAIFPRAVTTIACDVATPLPTARSNSRPPKAQGAARFVYLSRISPKKNLLTALCALRECRGEVRFDIYGPIQDDQYWRECVSVIAGMPSNVLVKYCGPLPPENVPERLGAYHFFVLPTLGENFGHAIHEALSAEVPVLIGCGTPWTSVTSMNAGWIIQPDIPAWHAAIQRAVMTPADEYALMAKSAGFVARTGAGFADAILANAQMLKAAVDMPSRPLAMTR